MESFFIRYKNPLILMAVLFVQVIALATQIKQPDNPGASNSGGTRLIRKWTITILTPFDRALTGTIHFFGNTWHNYIDLHDVRKENHELKGQIDQLKMERSRYKTEAEQSQRYAALLGFKERFVSQTVAGQVIQSSGSEQSRVIYIDRGFGDGIRQDMPVITPDGIVGKIKDVYPWSSQVLLIDDLESGAGVLLENGRLQGVLRGRGQQETQVTDIMSDEKVQAGDQVVTSGGDRIYPKGLAVGTVISAIADRDSEPFLRIRVRPAANLNRLEEVLVITKVAEESPSAGDNATSVRASDVLARRLPSITRPENKNAKGAAGGARTGPGSANPGGDPGPKTQITPNTVRTPANNAPGQPTTGTGAGVRKARPAPDATQTGKPPASGAEKPPQ
ncbi:MAG TPA: rod shape-determining protein MreC [Verrucomicrobiae bacterium]|jgi:rod shape-determining protein MreC|nr:rod shape-determining protein MreC [Verrucomicrobiae bacterium]